MPIGIATTGLNAIMNAISGLGMGAGYGLGIRLGYENLFPNLQQVPKFMSALASNDLDTVMSFMSGSSTSNDLDMSLQDQLHQNAVRKKQKELAESEVENMFQKSQITPDMKEAQRRENNERALENFASRNWDQSIVGKGLGKDQLRQAINQYNTIISNLQSRIAGEKNLKTKTGLNNQLRGYFNIRIQYQKALTFVLNNNTTT